MIFGGLGGTFEALSYYRGPPIIYVLRRLPSLWFEFEFELGRVVPLTRVTESVGLSRHIESVHRPHNTLLIPSSTQYAAAQDQVRILIQ